MADKVIFRVWPGGDVIALFPQIAATLDGYLCESYMHVGQHAAADPGIVQNTKLAKPKEYRELKEELERIGYVPVVAKRFTHRDFLIRQAQYQGA